jgi:hypothetical protein
MSTLGTQNQAESDERRVEGGLARVGRLQLQLRARHGELDELEPESDDYRAKLADVFSVTTEIVNYEARIPVLRDTVRREMSSRIIRWIGAAIAVAMVITALTTVPGWISRSWLLLVAPLLALAVAMVLAEGRRPREGHAARRTGAFLAAVVAVGVLLLAGSGLSQWALLVVIPLLVLACGLLAQPALSSKRAHGED